MSFNARRVVFAWAWHISAPLRNTTAWSSQLSPEVPWHCQTNASANQAFKEPTHSLFSSCSQKAKKKQICFWWEPHPTSKPTWIKNKPVFNHWTSLHHSEFSSGRYQMVKKGWDETKTHSSKGAGVSLAPSMRLIPMTQTALLTLKILTKKKKLKNQAKMLLWTCCGSFSLIDQGLTCDSSFWILLSTHRVYEF